MTVPDRNPGSGAAPHQPGEEESARDRNGLEVLPRARCLELLASRPVGRVALSHHALPIILPVNYRLIGDDIYFSTVTGAKSAAVSDRTVIAFEVDDIDPETRSGWSVLVVGLAEEIDSGLDPARRLTAMGLESWLGDRAAHLVRLPTERLSGRRLRPDWRPEPDAAGSDRPPAQGRRRAGSSKSVSQGYRHTAN